MRRVVKGIALLENFDGMGATHRVSQYRIIIRLD